jgi:ribosome-binding factor A
MRKPKDGQDGRRIARVEQEIQKVIAQYLIQGFRLPIPGIISVARVMMPADLRSAKIYVSHLGEAKDRAQVVELLQERAFEIQEHIGHELRMRYCPKLTFFLDDTTERILEIDRILHDLNANKKSGDKE